MARKNPDPPRNEPPKIDSPKSGERQTVQIPSEWHRSLVKLAARRTQPKIWTLCRLIGQACEAEGIEHPPYPWEEMEANG